MRLGLVLGALLVALAPLAAHAASQTPDGALASDVQHRIAAAVRHDMAEYGGKQPVTGAVLGVWYPGHGDYVRAIGDAQITPPRKLALDDRFRIGDNTMTFVATVPLQLVDEKKLSLDDPIGKFELPVRVPNGDHITLRQLMQMRSGLADVYALPAFKRLSIAPASSFDRAGWLQLALDEPALFDPGKRWNYSSTNYLLLGLAIESVTFANLQSEIQRRLLGPLGLDATSFPLTDPNMPDPYARGYVLDAKEAWLDQTVTMPPSVAWAAGVMISDLSDMKKWVKAYVTGTTNSAATQRERLACLPADADSESFGLGVVCSSGWYGFRGSRPGYTTAAYYLPAGDATIVALVNAQGKAGSEPQISDAIVRDVAKIVFPHNVPFAEPTNHD